jgi:hypothetical protein
MLRIAIWYENRLGRNDGNPLYIMAALKRMEAKGLLLADHLIPNGDTKYFGQYDLHIWVDYAEDAVASMLPYEFHFPTDAPVIYWASDTHLGYDFRLFQAKRSQIVFVAQKDAVEKFAKDGVSATWLPHAFEPRAYCDADDPTGTRPYELISKPYDIAFVGHISSENRVNALDRIFSEFPNFFYGQKLFNEAARKYAESKVVFNIAMKDDVNMRCFEVMGSKSFLLTDRVQSIDELFIDGKHCVMYNSLDEAVDKARYYIAHDDEREAIVREGYAEVMANHTIDHRLQVMLNKAFEKYPHLKESKEGVLV